MGAAASWAAATGFDASALRGQWYDTNGHSYQRANGNDWQTDQRYWTPQAFGANADGTDDTTAIQACIDKACTAQGTCMLPFASASTPNTYGFTNLKVCAWMTLSGSGMGQQTRLKRVNGAVGTAIREKTSAEGNASGAGGTWIRDLYIDGNGTAGDGINLGNQVAANQLNFNSGVQNVFVGSFTTGTGITLNMNAAKVSYIWSNSNAIGVITQGGGGYYDGVWAEGNSTYEVQVQSSDDTFVHVHGEMASVTPTAMLRVEGSQNRFFGVSLVQTANSVNSLVYIASGAVRNSFWEIMDNTNAHTFTNVVYVQAWLFGTGSTNYRVPFFIDVAGNMPGYIYSQTDNAAAQIGPNMGEPLGGDVSSASTIAPANTFFRVTGTTAIDTITPPATCSSGTVCCIDVAPTAAFTTTTGGNIAKASTAVAGQLMRLCYNPSTSKWYPSY